MKLCNCKHFTDCPAAIVRSEKAMQLCQTDRRVRDRFLRNRIKPEPGRDHGEMVGTVLARAIGWIKDIKGTSKCGCANLQAQMDKQGAEWCERNMDVIVAKMMVNADQLLEHTKFARAVVSSSVGRAACKVAAKMLVQRAIKVGREEAQKRLKKRAPREKPARGKTVRLAGTPKIPRDPIPFTGPPVLHLMFHVWPRGDAWRLHIEKLAPYLHLFETRNLGVAVDHKTASADETLAAFGPGWEATVVENKVARRGNRGLREVATYQHMLPSLPRGENDVTFCLHGKGVQKHNVGSDAVAWWTNAMYETVLFNHEEVIERMRGGAAIVGSFRRRGPMLRTRHKWHYSGTFYAFRNVIAFNNGVPEYRQRWWGTESWPGDHFPMSSSACIFGDNVGDLYNVDQQPRAELEKWRARHGVTTD